MTETPQIPEQPEALASLLTAVTLADERALRQLWQNIQRRRREGKPADRLVARFQKTCLQSQTLVQSRDSRVPEIQFPEALPISDKRQQIAELINAHQVVILAGETGSGKTTQLPKICLALGRGRRGQIGHTQPRRIAASTVASRIAEELQVPLGTTVGYQVRFTDQSDAASCVRLMTDGILLAEIQSDPLLLRYDTLIIDEAHERSLNIDFLLGYLKQILPQRPDLKLIITSATIDLTRFSEHFDNAPIMEVSGRTYPVEILYRPWAGEQDDQTQAIVEAVEEILTLPRRPDGDILIFLSGEREIREAAKALRQAQFPHIEVLPLYARLGLAEQNRVFQPHKGRRVVLATNVAETSITVPGIGYVIDPGYARISRYSVRNKLQRLPIEPISQASANQRAGRCGRVSNGVCIRLYDEEDFAQRPAFTDAEILRTNLAAVVLQMLHLGVGDIRRFPFVDPPENKQIKDGFKLLEELQAVNAQDQMTPLGRQLASLPLDPKLGRMVLAAHQLGCLKEMLVIAAALTMQDPRERPAEKQQAADEKHRRFWHEQSDFMAYLSLWDYAEEQRQNLSQNQWRKQCSREFLSYMRLREWRELHHQMRSAVRALGLKENTQPAGDEAIHRALLTGLLTQVGVKSEESGEWEYLGVRQRKFAIFPGSSQFKKRPKWIVAAEMLETSKVYGHCVARIEPEWLMACAEHLLKHHYYQPHYNAKTGQVMAYDRITFLGLVVADKQRVDFSKIDPTEARATFIRAALVEGDYGKNPHRAKGKFFARNQQEMEAVQTLEAKSRRRDILVDDEVVYQFYNERVPADIVNLAGFEHWRKSAEREQPDLLHIPQALLMQHQAQEITEVQFPDSLMLDGMILPLTYHFEPNHPDDGVSIGVPASVLHTLPEHRLEWLVPGLLREKCIALIKGLPKQWRKQFVPVPHYVDQMLARLQPSNRPLTEALSENLGRISGQQIPADIWQSVVLDDYYRMNIQVLDERQNVLERSRDLSDLREKYRAHVQTTLQNAGEDLERTQLQTWDFGPLEETCTLKQNGIQVRAFPALVAEPEGIALRMLDNPLEAKLKTRRGVLGLWLLHFAESVRHLKKSLLKNKDVGLAVANLGRREQVVEDIVLAAIAQVCMPDGELPRTASAFESAARQGAAQLVPEALDYERRLLEILAELVQIKKQLKSHRSALPLAMAFGDINQQLQNLLYSGFLVDTPKAWLEQYPRYFKAIQFRLEKAPLNVQKDKLAMASVSGHWEKHQQRWEKEGPAVFAHNPHWQNFRWMIEELRVSLFAQNLKTLMPVSDKRLNKVWADSKE